MSYITFKNIWKSYDKDPVLKGIDLEVEEGEPAAAKARCCAVWQGLSMCSRGVFCWKDAILPI